VLNHWQSTDDSQTPSACMDDGGVAAEYVGGLADEGSGRAGGGQHERDDDAAAARTDLFRKRSQPASPTRVHPGVGFLDLAAGAVRVFSDQDMRHVRDLARNLVLLADLASLVFPFCGIPPRTASWCWAGWHHGVCGPAVCSCAPTLCGPYCNFAGLFQWVVRHQQFERGAPDSAAADLVGQAGRAVCAWKGQAGVFAGG
jgi:hypothetical protein